MACRLGYQASSGPLLGCPAIPDPGRSRLVSTQTSASAGRGSPAIAAAGNCDMLTGYVPRPNLSDSLTAPATKRPLTQNQVRGFFAAWGGIVLDGMDSFIYALVLTPAMRDLLPASGIP